MRGRQRRERPEEREAVSVWPEPSLDVDDDEFARAIAEGRRSRAA